MKYAPIALFVYKRPNHLKRVVDSLLKNKAVSESELFIFSDGPKMEEDVGSVSEVRDYIETIDGFKKVNLIKRNRNLGLANSLISGVSEVISLYSQVIVLEDDIVVGPNFLEYMNEALRRYEKSEEVACIHGWNYPIKGKSSATFFLKGADCWGWATWKRAWVLFETDGKKLLNRIESLGLIREFDLVGAYPYTQMLKDQINGKNNSWAIRWHASMFCENKYTLHPFVSQVLNIGLDNSGTHCPDINETFYQNNNLNHRITEFPDTIEENQKTKKEIIRYLRKANQIGLRSSILNFIKKSIAYSKRSIKKFLHIDKAAVASPPTFEWFQGNYSTWDDALALCGGYNEDEILKKVASSSRLVRDGKAVFERDSVIFDKVQYSYPLLVSLLYSVSMLKNKLRLVDFGGSLGTTYFQNRNFLTSLDELSWNIVEQKHFVSLGRQEFSSKVLDFYLDIQDVFVSKEIDLILFSSSLQYISDPFGLLNEIEKFNFRFLLFDRIPFFIDPRLSDRISIQHVPDEIYRATYPAWFFNEPEFLAKLESKYRILFQFDSFENWSVSGDQVQNKCILLEKK